MGRPTVMIDLANDERLARDLQAGGVFIPGCELGLDTECDLVVRGRAGEQVVAARVVYVAPAGGAGLELVGFGPAIREQLASLGTEPPIEREAGPETEPEAEPEIEPPEPGDEPESRRLHDRLRGLSLAEQVKMAHAGDQTERMLLERIYGKNVWEPLLRNPRLTAPEVSRIARMGALPRPLLEVIVSNGSWLQIPEVRRALLSNPRLGTDQILRVLRLMPKHELKLASMQTAYPMAVRDAAKRLMKEHGA
jgi:hypothetical protein